MDADEIHIHQVRGGYALSSPSGQVLTRLDRSRDEVVNMTIYEPILIAATLLSSLVAGFVFSFAVVVMPGISSLEDGRFIQTFQAMDRVIQRNQPLFMVVWIGSAVAMIALTAVGVGGLEGVDRILLIVAAVAHLGGVHLPTVLFNVPLNNHLQTLDTDSMGESEIREARQTFESRWIRWNVVRTSVAVVTSILLMILALRS
jgi:uncharacterized membrane protein